MWGAGAELADFHPLSHRACAVGASCLKRGTRKAKRDISGARAQTGPASQPGNPLFYSSSVATITFSLEHEFPHAVGPQHCQDS